MKGAVLRHWRVVSVWLVALAAACASAWAVHVHLQRQEAEIERRARVVQIERLAAASDLSEGHLLRESDLLVRDFPEAWVSSQAVPPERWEDVVGARLRAALREGEPILISQLEHMHSNEILSSQVTAGRRALSLSLRDVGGVPRGLRSGDHVDLFVSLSHGGRLLTLPLLSDSRVLYVTNEAGEPAQVLLEVHPEETVRFVAGKQAGVLTLSLRSTQDPKTMNEAPARVDAVDLAAILGLASPDTPIDVLYGDSLVGRSQRPGLDIPWQDDEGSELP